MVDTPDRNTKLGTNSGILPLLKPH